MKSTVIILLFICISWAGMAQNVGVNTNTPMKTLSVNGSISLDHTSKNFGTLDSASLVFGALPVTVGISSNKSLAGINPNGLDFWTNKLKRLVIQDDGNIGIGTTTPASKLHIGLGTDVSLVSNGYFMLGNEAGQNLAMDINEIQARVNGAASTLFLQNNAGALQVGSSSDNNLRISGSNIQAYFNGASDELVLQGLNGGKIRLGSTLDFANTKLHISTGVDAGLGAANSGYMMIGPSTGENLVFDNNEILARNNGVASTLFLARDGSTVQLGNGTAQTGTKLHLSTGFDAGLPNAQSGFLMMGSQTSSNMVLDNNEIQARTNGAASTLFLQNAGGNIDAKGDFYLQNDSPLIQFRNASSTNIGFVQASANDFQVGTNAGNTTGDLVLRTNGANRVYINSAGSISIGTATPAVGYMVSVNGKVMVEELKVQLSQNWPDYVFSDKYKLKSFDELRNYIAENKRLPNIPAASEVEKAGLEVGEMQRKMMEKIEELTLYVLQLEEKIKKLEK